jgi:hypothetical protein
MASFWVFPGPKIAGCFFPGWNLLFTPKLELVVIFVKSDVAIFLALDLPPLYPLGVVAVGFWTFLFFATSTIKDPNQNIFAQIKIFCTSFRV